MKKKNLTDEERELIDAVVQRHAPWIQGAIKGLRKAGRITSQHDDDDFYATGYNALVEALSSYDPSKASFKTHANKILNYRIRGQLEKEMARSGGGGVDPYFLTQARAEKRVKEAKEQPVTETKPSQEVQPSTETKPSQEVQPSTETEPSQEVQPAVPKKPTY